MNKNIEKTFSMRDEANAITAFCFRNGMIESIHAGKHSDLLQDESISRITDNEMKELMIEASIKLCSLLKLKETEPDKYQMIIREYGSLHCGSWER